MSATPGRPGELPATPTPVPTPIDACALRPRLNDPDARLRQAALASLLDPAVDPSPAMADVAACLADSDPSVRELAVVVLGRVGERAVPALTRALHEQQETAVRIAAASVLARLGRVAAPAIEPLCRCADSPDEKLRVHASLALSRIGQPAIPRLRALLTATDPSTRCAALDALAWIGAAARDAVDDVRQLTSSPSAAVRVHSLRALVAITGDPAQGLLPLLAMLEQQDTPLRLSVVERIGELMEVARPAVPRLTACLLDRSSRVRAAAALALARIRAADPKVVGALTQLLRDPVPDVAGNAGIALASFGSIAAPALPALRAMQQHPEQRVAAVATAAVERIAAPTS